MYQGCDGAWCLLPLPAITPTPLPWRGAAWSPSHGGASSSALQQLWQSGPNGPLQTPRAHSTESYPFPEVGAGSVGWTLRDTGTWSLFQIPLCHYGTIPPCTSFLLVGCVCLTTPNSCGNLSPSVVVPQGRVPGKGLGHRGRAFVNETHALSKEVCRVSLAPLPSATGGHSSCTWTWGLPICWHLGLGLLDSRL